MLYRHVQPLFVCPDYSDQPIRGPRMRIRPLDTDAPDHQMRFVLWGAIQVAEVSAPAAPPKATDPVTTPKPQLLLEVSPDGEGWVVVATLDPRERPYLVPVAHMLPFVRARLDTRGVPTRGSVHVLANTPFQLDGPSPLVEGHEPGVVVVTGTRR